MGEPRRRRGPAAWFHTEGLQALTCRDYVDINRTPRYAGIPCIGKRRKNKPVNPEALGGTKLAAKWESGIDNGPVFDDAYFNEQTHQMELADTGLIGMYIADANALAEMADILDRKQDAEWLRGSAQKYSEKLATLWNPAAGIFLDKICARENSINALLRRVSIQCFPKLQHLTKLTKC